MTFFIVLMGQKTSESPRQQGLSHIYIYNVNAFELF